MHAEEEPPVAVLNSLKKARELVDACESLFLDDFDGIPDEMLEEGVNDIEAIEEMCKEIYEMLLTQLCSNELANMKADKQAPPHDEEPAEADIEDSPLDDKSRAEGLLFHGYMSMCSLFRKRGREGEYDEKDMQRVFAEYDSLVEKMAEADRADLNQREKRYHARASKLYEQVLAMLEFWGLPEIPGPAAHRCPPALGPAVNRPRSDD